MSEPRVVSLHRYPIKGMSAESLDTVALTARRGFPHDRAWGFARHDSGFDADDPQPLPKTKFLMLMRDERLAGLDTDFDPDSSLLVVSVRGDEALRVDLGTADGRDAASAFYAAMFDLAPHEAPRFVSAGLHRFTDVSVVSEALMHAVSLVNLASVRDLEQRTGRTIEVERFRANIVVDGLDPWAELDLVDRGLTLGDVPMHGVLRTRRCAATEVNPASAKRDVPVPRLIHTHLGHPDMGVYLEIDGAGTLRVGDALDIEPA